MTTSLHHCLPAALATLAGDLHGGSLVLLDAGSAEAIASAVGMKLLTGKFSFSRPSSFLSFFSCLSRPLLPPN
jgi:hypothetical protein